jgi:hypothetical protein
MAAKIERRGVRLLKDASFVDLLAEGLIASKLEGGGPSLVEDGFLLADLVALQVVKHLKRVLAVVRLVERGKRHEDGSKRASTEWCTYVGKPEAKQAGVLAVAWQCLAREHLGAPFDEGDELLAAIICHQALLCPVHIPGVPQPRLLGWLSTTS